jgi:hypothetical protein
LEPKLTLPGRASASFTMSESVFAGTLGCTTAMLGTAVISAMVAPSSRVRSAITATCVDAAEAFGVAGVAFRAAGSAFGFAATDFEDQRNALLDPCPTLLRGFARTLVEQDAHKVLFVYRDLKKWKQMEEEEQGATKHKRPVVFNLLKHKDGETGCMSHQSPYRRPKINDQQHHENDRQAR